MKVRSTLLLAQRTRGEMMELTKNEAEGKLYVLAWFPVSSCS